MLKVTTVSRNTPQGRRIFTWMPRNVAARAIAAAAYVWRRGPAALSSRAMSPTTGVLGEAWALYKAHWRHLLSISFVVYAGVAALSVLLTALLSWLGSIIAAVVTVVALFW